MDSILDVDLIAFEQGSAAERSAVVDGTMRSLETGFVYAAHDVSTELIDEAYDKLATFFALDTETKAQAAALERTAKPVTQACWSRLLPIATVQTGKRC